jgi:hypothetical protein
MALRERFDRGLALDAFRVEDDEDVARAAAQNATQVVRLLVGKRRERDFDLEGMAKKPGRWITLAAWKRHSPSTRKAGSAE